VNKICDTSNLDYAHYLVSFDPEMHRTRPVYVTTSHMYAKRNHNAE